MICDLICDLPQADHDWFYLFLFLNPALHSRENILQRIFSVKLFLISWLKKTLSFHEPLAPTANTHQIKTAMAINNSHVFLIKLECVYALR